jgi:hypothetical protein
MNYEFRPQLLDKISGVILLGDKDKSFQASLFKWLGMRRILLIKMDLGFEDDNSFSSCIENDYVDQFRYNQHVFMRGVIRDDMSIFIISRCPCLLSFDISELRGFSSLYPQVTYHTLQSIAEHCSGRLQSLSLSCCSEITDAGLIIISMHCLTLKSLKVDTCDQITDASIISVSTYTIGLQSFDLRNFRKITDASIISISTHCVGLQSLNLGL